jgi:hypothetical protein
MVSDSPAPSLGSGPRTLEVPGSEGPAITFHFKPARLSILLAAIAGLLILADAAGLVSTYLFHHRSLLGLVRLFNLNEEANIPTYYSAMLLLLCSGLLILIGTLSKHEGSRYRSWQVLGGIFFYLSLDEVAQLHETLGMLMDKCLPALNILQFNWVLVYGPLGIILMICMRRFIMQLPARIRWLTLLAGFVYVGGAIGIETVSGQYLAFTGQRDCVFNLIAMVEESCEMMGAVIFVYALTSYIDVHFGPLMLRPTFQG